jgi:hypothetical protein
MTGVLITVGILLLFAESIGGVEIDGGGRLIDSIKLFVIPSERHRKCICIIVVFVVKIYDFLINHVQFINILPKALKFNCFGIINFMMLIHCDQDADACTISLF